MDDVDKLEALLDSYTAEAALQNRQLDAKTGQHGKPRKEKLVREAGLQQPLDARNKGYILMRKMGYEDGKGIGSTGAGRTELVPLDLKAGRSGLGLDERRKRERQERQRQEELQRAKLARHSAEVQQCFQEKARAGYTTRQTIRHLYGAWRVAQQLDERTAVYDDIATTYGTGHIQGSPGPSSEGRRCTNAESGGEGGRRAVPGASVAHMQLSLKLQALLARLPTVEAMLDGQAREEGGQKGGQGDVGASCESSEQPACSSRRDLGHQIGRQCGEMESSAGGGKGAESEGRSDTGPHDNDVAGGEVRSNADEEAVKAGIAIAGALQVRDLKEQLPTRTVDGAAGGGGDGRWGDGAGGAGGIVEGEGRCGDDDRVGEGVATTNAATAARLACRQAQSLVEELEVLLVHLRAHHCYCYFCGCQYDSAEELAAACPGLGEEMH